METINTVEATGEVVVDAIETTAAATKGFFGKAADAVKTAAANPRNQNIAIGVGAVAALGLVGWGAKKLWDNRQAKKAATSARERAEAVVAATKEGISDVTDAVSNAAESVVDAATK